MHLLGRSIKEIAAASTKESVSTEEKVLKHIRDMPVHMPLSEPNASKVISDANLIPFIDPACDQRHLIPSSRRTNDSQARAFSLARQLMVHADMIVVGMRIQNPTKLDTKPLASLEDWPRLWTVHDKSLTGSYVY